MIDKKTKIGRKFLFPSSVVTAMQGQSINYLTYTFSILMPLLPHKNLSTVTLNARTNCGQNLYGVAFAFHQ